MNKYILLIVLSMCISTHLVAQNTKGIHLEFNESEFRLEMNNGLLYIRSLFSESEYLSNLGEPALPFINVNVLVAPDEDLDGFDVVRNEGLIRKDVLIASVSGQKPTGVQKQDEAKESGESAANCSRDELTVFAGMHIMDGYRFLSFAVCPFRYDVVTRELYLSNSIDLQVMTKKSIRATNTSSHTAGIVMHDIVRDMVINADEMDALYGSSYRRNLSLASNDSSVIRSGSDYNYQYLIITNETLKPSFQRLADWKIQKGVRSKVLTVDEIDDDYQGSRQQLRIKQAISDYWTGSQHSLKYVLLGGDVDIVPAQMASISKKFGFLTETTPADLFYSCLDTFDWDPNGNGVYGEIDDSVDIAADLFLTRLPVNSVLQADSIVKRIIKYETSPDMRASSYDLLLSGTQIANIPYYVINGVTMSDAQYKSEWMYNDYISNNWGGNMVRFFDTYTDISNDASYNFTAQNLQTELSRGYAFVDIQTHGLYNAMAMETGNPFSNSHALGVNNERGNTIITTEACLTNAFDSLTCLSEAFFRNLDSGVIGYFGCSRDGWYNDSIVFMGRSLTLNGEFYKNLFTKVDKNFGYISAMAKNTLVTWAYNSVSADRWLLFAVNPLGDPEMPVYISTPQRFNNVSYFFRNDSLIVNTGLDSCRICVMSVADKGSSYYVVKEIVSGASFLLPTVDCSICITKTGYIPTVQDYYNIKYIQNETIQQDKLILANQVVISSNADPTAVQGSNSIISGKTSIISRSVSILKDFSVDSGAELYIGPQ